MLDTFDAAAVRRWCGGGLEMLRAHQHEIDELNVYPVPDGDTGTNLVLTLTAALHALATDHDATDDDAPSDQVAGRDVADDPARDHGGGLSAALSGELVASAEPRTTPLGRAMRRMARGALLGARGNSGVIVSQILRGMADSFATTVAVRGGELARALRAASEAAYAAVARPVEGTVLSVVAAAAEGAGRIKSDDLVAVARAAARAAAEALARTPQQLPALARAGVVDAGGRGLCLLLDALVVALGPADPPTAVGSARSPAPPGESASVPTSDPVAPAAAVRRADVADPAIDGADPGADDNQDPDSFGYEVQYLLDAHPGAVDVLRHALATLGDSLVVVGTGDGVPPTWNVHVHVRVEDVGTALEVGVVAGRPHRITVTPLTGAGHEPPGHEPADPAPHGTEPQKLTATASSASTLSASTSSASMSGGPALGGPDPVARGAVVVAAGDGLTALFTAEGATVAGQNPSTASILEAIIATGAGSVVLLPNDANTHAVARAAAHEAEASGVRVSVVPTRSPVQALAALAVRDPQRPFADDVIAMAEAAGACRYGEVCTAQRASLTVAGPCRAGDLLGLVDGEVHVIGVYLNDVSRRLLDRMLGGGGELVTLVLGADAPTALEGSLRGHLAQIWPFVELQCYAGGQPRYHLLVGVE